MITIKQVLENCEYDRIYLRIRTWDKYGVQVLDEEGYCLKGENGEWSGEDLNLGVEICGYKWRGELDKDCPVLCINRGAHWIEFDPESRKAIDMCQISDGYQAYLTRKKVMRS